MGMLRLVRQHSTLFAFSVSLAASVTFVACGSDEGTTTGGGTGGTDAGATGGSSGTGGGSSTGGTAGTGGTSATGGTAGTGGTSATGGTAGTGGSTSPTDSGSDSMTSNGDAMTDGMVPDASGTP